jgi:glutamine---fructose-6-phosphate transaminase (isomerizing)
MTKHDTEPTWGKGAVTTRTPLPSVVFSKIATARWYRHGSVPGQLTRKAIAAQPEWLRQVPERVGDRRFPGGAEVLFTGCGTSFHAALACGRAEQALEIVLGGAPDADVLVAISHEGETTLTLEAIRGFDGETWVITGAPESPLAKEVDHVVVATPEIEESYCHTVSYTCAVAAGRALGGEDVSRLATDVFRELDAEPLGASGHDRFAVVGAGRDTATVLEAVLKLREGAHVAAESHHTEQLLHGHLAAIDPSVRCIVLEGEGRAAERAVDAMRALGELGCDALLVPTTHPVVDIVRFQRLTCDLAEARGIDPDMIRWDEDPWNRARQAQAFMDDP